LFYHGRKNNQDDVRVDNFLLYQSLEIINGEDIRWAIERNMHQKEAPCHSPQGSAQNAKAAESDIGLPMKALLSYWASQGTRQG